MSQEKGGRADKFGNLYEDRCLVEQLIRLSREDILSVVHESVHLDGTDFQIKNLDGNIVYYQCKGWDGIKNGWSMAALKAKDIFSYAKKVIDFDQNNYYKFVSSLRCEAMVTLTQRAKNCASDPQHFYEFQIKARSGEVNAVIEKNYCAFLKYMGLDASKKDDDAVVRQAIHYLSHMEFAVISDTEYQRDTLLERISDIFNAKPKPVYSTLLTYTVDNGLLGHSISSKKLNDYLAEQGIYKYDLSNHDKIWPRIQVLNEEFYTSFSPISDCIIHRPETDVACSHIKQGHSVILHGKAGSGKSGCVQELTARLVQEKIPYLAIRLDKRIPTGSAHLFGANELDLPASPVLCLRKITGHEQSVLILDQLDALRWTAQHSKTALDVCKELVGQAERHNVSIVLVCRTHDAENDPGIRSLFSKDNPHFWQRVQIGELSDESVKNVVGDNYKVLTEKLRQLLRNANNLYIYSRLDNGRKERPYASTYDLISEYWKQFKQRCGSHSGDATALKDVLIKTMINTHRLFVPRVITDKCSDIVIDKAISEGILMAERNTLSFVHQSFFDVFVVEAMWGDLYSGKSLVEMLGSKSRQTPSVRYQLQMLLQNLAESDQALFIQCGAMLLDSTDVRYYMKYVFWEVVGQLASPDSRVFELIDRYLDVPQWTQAIINYVIFGHPNFVEHYIQNGMLSSWLESDKASIAFNLLRSVNITLGDQIVGILEPLACKSDETDENIYRTLCWEAKDDTDAMFDLRLRIISKNPNLRKGHLDFASLATVSPVKAVSLFAYMLKADATIAEENIGHYIHTDHDICSDIGQKVPHLVWEEIVPIVEGVTVADSYWTVARGWSTFGDETTLGRGIVRMIISAGRQLAEEESKIYDQYFKRYAQTKSFVIREVLLYTLGTLPTTYSDAVIKWLISDNLINLFDETGTHKKKLEASRNLIEHFSKTCSDTAFTSIEQAILQYHEKRELDIARDRFQYNHGVRNGTTKSDFGEAYWPYWGMVQAYLLPALDSTRISDKTKQLIGVLERRFAGFELGGNKSGVESGFVGSTISQDIAYKFSDEQWLKIIRSEKLCSREHLNKVARRFRFKESTHEMFSNQFESAGNRDPNRFVALARKFTQDVDRHYWQAIFSIASKNSAPDGQADWEQADFSSLQDIVEKSLLHPEKDEYNMCCSFLRLVEDRAGEDWSKTIIDRIMFLAQDYPDPYIDREDIKDLETSSLNCVRGVAAHTIARMLWADENRYLLLKPIIDALVYDEHAVIRQAILEAVVATANIDKRQSAIWFFSLANSDERIARYNRARTMIFCLWKEYREECIEIVNKLFLSQDESSAESGAFTATNLYIVFEHADVFSTMLFSKQLSAAQIKGCCQVAIALMKNSEYHDKAKSVIEEIVLYPHELSEGLGRIFFHDCFVLPQDSELIRAIIALSPRKHTHDFIRYLKKKEISALPFIEILLQACAQYVNDKSGVYYGSLNDLSACIASIYDQATDNLELRDKCLDIWDILYESDSGDIRAITRQIMDR